MTTASSPTSNELSAARKSRTPRGIAIWILATTVAVALFDLFSAGNPIALRGFGGGGAKYVKPPVYGSFEPRWTRFVILSLALAAGVVVVSYIITRWSRARLRWLLPAVIAFMLTFSCAIAAQRQDGKHALATLRRQTTIEDVDFARAVGIRNFVRTFDERLPELSSVTDQTHPPGRVATLALLARWWPDHLLPRALVLAALATLVLVPTWFLARWVADEQAARYAVLLLAVAPGPVMFSFVSLESVEATLLVGGAVLAIYGGIGKRGPPWLSFVGGLLLGLTTLLTYAVVFVVAGLVLLALLTHPPREVARALASLAAGLLAGVVFLRVTLGFDLAGSYQATRDLLRAHYLMRDAAGRTRPALYWLFGNPAVWLTFAGVALGGAALRELIVVRPRYLLAFFAPLAIFYVLPARLTLIIPGEVERTLAFAYPFAAVAAAAAIRRETLSSRRSPAFVAIVVGSVALQTILLAALFIPQLRSARLV